MALQIEWTEEARSDIRALDRPTAMHIFEGIHRYALTGEGDVKTLEGKHAGKLRLRLGSYRIFFRSDHKLLWMLAVKHRREAYR